MASETRDIQVFQPQRVEVPEVSITDIEPRPPADVDQQRIESAEEIAERIAQEIIANSRRTLVEGQIRQIGSGPALELNSNVSLLQEKVGAVIKADTDETEGEVPKNLLELRKLMDDLNPDVQLTELQSIKGFWDFLVKGILRRVPGMGDALADIAIKHETVGEQITIVKNSLRQGQDTLGRSSVELDQLYEAMQKLQVDVFLEAYAAEVLWVKINEQLRDLDPIEDADKIRRLQTYANMAARKASDLRLETAVNSQLFVAVDSTIDNNSQLITLVDRTINLAERAMTVALMIAAAQSQQKRVLNASQMTEAHITERLQQNAVGIRQLGISIAEARQNPAIATEQMQSIQQQYVGLVEEIEAIQKLGTEKAQAEIAAYHQMNDDFKGIIDAVHAARLSEAVEGEGEEDDEE